MQNDIYFPGMQTSQNQNDNIYFPGMNTQPANTSDVYFPGMKVQSKSSDPWSNFKQTASTIAQEQNYPLDVLEAQAALESAHGTSPMAQSKNNYFGYMAYNSNPDAASTYNTPADSINDYINLIKNTSRYSWAYNQWLQDGDSQEFLKNIIRSGYAVSPGMDQETKAQEYTNHAFAALGN